MFVSLEFYSRIICSVNNRKKKSNEYKLSLPPKEYEKYDMKEGVHILRHQVSRHSLPFYLSFSVRLHDSIQEENFHYLVFDL